ncbi:hypothetical protein N657DRAFT_613434 [Parathielavia appendiculata]|uniref:Uncharacterized protein n=1 Tax=Parathielavia appendiculata TaxID=2587402 RepID=A0AAN6Z507_9PEZI|nr:hypothetical protein N657DRAFT_613434 [Parathielavia appendiculata]
MAGFFKKHKEADKPGKTGTNEIAQAASATKDALAPGAPEGDKPAPVLDDEDEQFLQRLVSNDDDDGPPPPLPPRPKTPDLTWDSDSESIRLAQNEKPAESTTTTTTTTTAKKPNRLSRLFHHKPSSSSNNNTLTVPNSSTTVPPEEADREWADLNLVLSRLGIEPTSTEVTEFSNLSKSPTPSKTKAAALAASVEVQSLLRQFVLVLKDITNGAPTAVDDLISLLDGRNDVLKRGFEKLPGSMQKLVTQLPKKLTSSLGPEMLAAAAEAQGLRKETDAGGLARFLMPKNLGDLREAGEGGNGEGGKGGCITGGEKRGG